MQWVKVREKIAALFALVLVVLLAALIAVAMGWNVPVLSDLAQQLGYSGNVVE